MPDWVFANGVKGLNSVGLTVLGDLFTQSGGIDVIPTHSFLMEGWIIAGVGGLAFWVYTLALVTRAVTPKLSSGHNQFLTAFLYPYLVWTIFLADWVEMADSPPL